MGMRVTCRENAATSNGEVLSFNLWMRGGATPPPMHVNPHQEERIAVVAGAVRSRSGGSDRVLSSGETVVSSPGQPHAVGPAGDEDVEMVAELRPALTYEQFIERSFALDRAGHVDAKGPRQPTPAVDHRGPERRVLPCAHPARHSTGDAGGYGACGSPPRLRRATLNAAAQLRYIGKTHDRLAKQSLVLVITLLVE